MPAASSNVSSPPLDPVPCMRRSASTSAAKPKASLQPPPRMLKAESVPDRSVAFDPAVKPATLSRPQMRKAQSLPEGPVASFIDSAVDAVKLPPPQSGDARPPPRPLQARKPGAPKLTESKKRLLQTPEETAAARRKFKQMSEDDRRRRMGLLGPVRDRGSNSPSIVLYTRIIRPLRC